MVKGKKLAARERREQIIYTAMNLFAQNGFNGTTTKELASSAGVSEALLFRFFPRKSALYRSIIQHKMEQSIDERALLRRDEETYEEYFFRLSHAFIRMVEQDDSFMRILLFSALEGHSLSNMFFRVRVTRNIRVISRVIAQGIRQGRFKRVDPVLAARMFMGLNFHYLQLKKLFKVTTPPLAPGKLMSEAIVDLFLNGIKRKGK